VAASRKIAVRSAQVTIPSVTASLTEGSIVVSGKHIIVKRIRVVISVAGGSTQAALELRQVASGTGMDVRSVFTLTSPASGSPFAIDDNNLGGDGIYMTTTASGDDFLVYVAVAGDTAGPATMIVSIDFEDAH